MKYDLILADPPWHWQNWGGDEPGHIMAWGPNRRGAQRHYPTMSLEDICTLPVGKLANPDSVLLLWACGPLLPESLEVISAWGFSYRSLAWPWIKSNRSGFGFFMGQGFWTRANAELCLLATKGKGLERRDKGVLGLIYSPVREHSRKPDEQYEKIDRLFGTEISKVELFARRRWRDDWDVWGNEIEDTIELARAGVA